MAERGWTAFLLSLSHHTPNASNGSSVPVILLTAAAIACGALQPTLADCPRMCDCKWKNGKESVMCVNASLTEIPLHVDVSTQLLDLTGNSLGQITQDAFANAGLVHLQKLFLVHCKLKFLDEYAFRKLTNLIELDLSQNDLLAVPSASLQTIPGLRELRLNRNPISTLVANGFKNVPQLVRLELSFCRVATIENGSFAGLEKSLEWLKLDNNGLSFVGHSAIKGLLGLNGLELAGNPWNCSCALRPLKEWMLKRNVPTTKPPTCTAPSRIAGRFWDDLDLDEFACAPSATVMSKVISVVEGGDATLRCVVRGAPGPDVRWLYQGLRPIANLSGSGNPSNTRRLFLMRTSTTNSNLTIISVEGRDAGVYMCSAENRAGRAHSNVTLHIERRTYEKILTGRLVAATLSVAILLVTASCLVALCVCRLRKYRQGWVLAPISLGECHEESYEKIEMYHKKLDYCVKSNGGVNVIRPVRVPFHEKKNGWYTGVSLTDEDEGGYEAEVETPTPTTGPKLNPRRSPWTTNQSSSQDSFTGAGSTSPPSRTSPARTMSGYWPDSLRCGSSVLSKHKSEGSSSHRSSFEPTDNLAAAVAAGLPQHVLRKQVLSGSGGSLYTSLLHGSEDTSFPDFLVLSPLSQEPPQQPLSSRQDSNIFCTLPRRKSSNGFHQSHYDSESPLLPESRYGSSDGSSSSSHRAEREIPSISSVSGLYYHRANSLLSLNSPSEVGRTLHGRVGQHSYPSLPGSPVGGSIMETPILKALGKGYSSCRPLSGTSRSFDSSRTMYERRTSQFDVFADEYQRLHDELNKMKEICRSKHSADNFPRVPKSILKNKNAFLSPEASTSYDKYLPPYWLPRDALLRKISGNDFIES